MAPLLTLLFNISLLGNTKGKKYSRGVQFAIGTTAVSLVALVCYYSQPFLGYRTVALLLLLTVSVLAMVFDILPVLAAAVLSALSWNYFFIPPAFTFRIATGEDLLMFLLYFIIALVNAVLTFRIRRAEKRARDKEEKENAILLYNTLLNSLSHELRTPIATIIGATDNLKELSGRLTTEQQAELMQQVETAGLRLNRQVENLLNMSRLETGMLQPNPDWCDTNELIGSIIQKTGSTGTHHFIFEPDEHLPLLRYDRGFMEQVLHNLVHNAMAYTPAGSIIKLAAAYHNERCCIVVSDNGPGIPEQQRALVFDKFYRLPGTGAGGSGLGLSIVQGFVLALKGTIELTQSEQGGAQFTMEIPAEASYIHNLHHE